MQLLASALDATPLPEVIVLPPLAQWVILLSLVYGAARLLWSKAIQPLARLGDIIPVIAEIADHFKPNGGSSLYDVVTDIRNVQGTIRTDLEALRTSHERLNLQVNPASPADERLDQLRDILTSISGDTHTIRERQQSTDVMRTLDAPPPSDPPVEELAGRRT